MRQNVIGAKRLQLALLGAVAMSVLSISPAVAAPSAAGLLHSEIAAVRAATAPFHDLTAADAAGYGLFPGCFAHAEGGMGVHFVRGDLVGDAAVDPLRPEAMVYEPLGGGRYRLVAVEWVVIAAPWDADHASPPEILGQPLTFVPAPNEFGLPDFYELHAWIWQPNPLGMFHEWNPLVSCDPA